MASSKRKATQPVRVSDKWIGRTFKQFHRARVMLSVEEVERIDACLQGKPDGMNRRLALIAMMKSGKELIELANSDRDGAIVVATIAEAAKLSYKRMLDLADTFKVAEMRAMLALYERKDRDSVIAEAQAGFERYDYNEPKVSHGH